MDDDYASYLIRLSREASADGTVAWRGELESIQTGQRWRFPDLASLCDFLQARMRDDAQTGKGRIKTEQ